MNIEIKKSIKPINYFDAINFIGERLEDLHKNMIKSLFGHWNTMKYLQQVQVIKKVKF